MMNTSKESNARYACPYPKGRQSLFNDSSKAMARFSLEVQYDEKPARPPTTPCNPVSLSVTDISDCMPMVVEDVPMLNIDDLLEPEFPCLNDLLEEPDRPEYCSQNGGDCSTCSLVNYGLDCMNNRVSGREVNHG